MSRKHDMQLLRDMATILIDVAEKGETIRYKNLDTTLPPLSNYTGVTYSQSDLRSMGSPLGELSEICIDNRLPLLSCLVVGLDEKMQPGEGFFKWFFENEPKSKWYELFIIELKKVHNAVKQGRFSNFISFI